MEARLIARARAPLDAELEAPPSKSVTHRALVAAALADGESVLDDPLESDDTRATRDGLLRLGVTVRCEPGRWHVRGCAGRPPGAGSLALGESGTTMRFLTGVAALGAAPSRLDGAPRLRERPLAELLDALRGLGARIREEERAGCLPLVVGGERPHGGRVSLPGGRSSQFASALLLVAPWLEGGIDLSLEPPRVSLPYVALTVRVLADFGVHVTALSESRFRVAGGSYAGRTYRIEGDHSSASYPLAAAALVGGRVRVRHLQPGSVQPDARLGELLERLGCTVTRGEDWIEVCGSGRIPAFDFDLGQAPDLVPTFAVLALFAEGPSVLRGIPHLRLKESDRLGLVAENLRALGREASALHDRILVHGEPAALVGTRIETGGDHRLAMAFAIAGLRLAGVQIDAPRAVEKSNPGFWRQLAALADGSAS